MRITTVWFVQGQTYVTPGDARLSSRGVHRSVERLCRHAVLPVGEDVG